MKMGCGLWFGYADLICERLGTDWGLHRCWSCPGCRGRHDGYKRYMGAAHHTKKKCWTLDIKQVHNAKM